LLNPVTSQVSGVTVGYATKPQYNSINFSTDYLKLSNEELSNLGYWSKIYGSGGEILGFVSEFGGWVDTNGVYFVELPEGLNTGIIYYEYENRDAVNTAIQQIHTSSAEAAAEHDNVVAELEKILDFSQFFVTFRDFVMTYWYFGMYWFIAVIGTALIHRQIILVYVKPRQERALSRAEAIAEEKAYERLLASERRKVRVREQLAEDARKRREEKVQEELQKRQYEIAETRVRDVSTQEVGVVLRESTQAPVANRTGYRNQTVVIGSDVTRDRKYFDEYLDKKYADDESVTEDWEGLHEDMIDDMAMDDHFDSSAETVRKRQQPPKRVTAPAYDGDDEDDGY
jgi:hypothetical protein